MECTPTKLPQKIKAVKLSPYASRNNQEVLSTESTEGGP